MAGLDVAQLKTLPVHGCILTLHTINTMVNCMRAAGLDFAGITLRKDLVKIVLSSSVVSEEDFKLHFADLLDCEPLPNNWPNQLPVNARWAASLTVGSILEGFQLTRLGELLLLLQPSPDHVSRFPADSMFVFGITGLRDAFDAHSGLVYTAHALPALLPNWLKFADLPTSLLQDLPLSNVEQILALSIRGRWSDPSTRTGVLEECVFSVLLDYDVLSSYLSDYGLSLNLVEVLRSLNTTIDDRHYEVGISFFLKDGAKLKSTLEVIWRGEIEPYLEEYFFDQPDRTSEFRWDHLVQSALADWANFD